MDRGAWQATVHGVTKSWTRLSRHTQVLTTCIHVDDAYDTHVCAHRYMFAWVCLYMKVFLALVTEKIQRDSNTVITPGALVLDIIPCLTKRNDGSAEKRLSPGFIWKCFYFVFERYCHSVRFSHSVMSHSLQSHGLQHPRLPCPSPTPGACSNSRPLSQWCQTTISFSAAPFSSCLQSFPASGSFQMGQLFAPGGQRIGISLGISPSNEYSGLTSFRIDWFDLLAVQGTLKSLLQHHTSKASILRCSAFFIVQPSHPYMTPGKTIALTRWTFVGKVMSLLFNMLSVLVIAFLIS